VPDGFIEVGLSPDGKTVVLNHPKIAQSENGGHIIFTPAQALSLARTLIHAALESICEH
jgi:hypothetical protein